MIFEKKKTAILLVVIIGLTGFVGLASAAGTPNPVMQVLQILLGMQPQATPNSLILDSIVTVPAQSSRVVELLPLKSGVTYSGHISIDVAGDFSRVFILAVQNADEIALNPSPSVGTVNTDFASLALWVGIENAGITNIDVNFAGVVQYYNCTHPVTWIPHDA